MPTATPTATSTTTTNMTCAAIVCTGTIIIQARRYSIPRTCIHHGGGVISLHFMLGSVGDMIRGGITPRIILGCAEPTTRQYTRAGGIRRTTRGGEVIMVGADIMVMDTVADMDMATERAVAVRRERLA
mgnify:CR=1 FL=1